MKWQVLFMILCGEVDIYPSKKEIVKDIRHHELYVLEKDNKIIGAMVLNHEYDECYNKLSWQIFADDDEVLILHRLCIHPQYRGCGKFLIKQAIEIAKFLNQKSDSFRCIMYK